MLISLVHNDRLGVGAVLPESEALNARESAKLKHKLVGRDSKTKGEDTRASNSKVSGLKPKGGDTDEDEDDEPRKGSFSGGSMSAKTKSLARPDPFSKPTKKAKKSKLTDGNDVPDTELAREKASIAPETVTQALKESSPPKELPEPLAHDGRTKLDQASAPSNSADKEVLVSPEKKELQMSVEASGSQHDTSINKYLALSKSDTNGIKKDHGAVPIVPQTQSSTCTNGVTNHDTRNQSLVSEGSTAKELEGKDEQNTDSWEGFNDSEDEQPPQSNLCRPSKDSYSVVEKVLSISVPEADDGRPLLNLLGPPTDTIDEKDGSPQNPSKSKRKKRRRNKNRNKINGSNDLS